MTVKTKNTTTKPSNADSKKVSELKQLINLSLKTDSELKKINLKKDDVGNKFVDYYADLDAKQFSAKQQKDAIANDIFLRLKGFKNSKTAKPITGSAKTMTSVIKAYIVKVGVITKGTTYTAIRKEVNKLNAKTISEERKKMLKFIDALTDEQLKALITSAKKSAKK